MARGAQRGRAAHSAGRRCHGPELSWLRRPLEQNRVCRAFIGLQAIAAYGRDGPEIDKAIQVFAGQSNGGLILLPTPINSVHRHAIFALAERHRLPAIYPFGFHARNGGLMAYGFDSQDLFRRAAAYVDRILKGARPAELPVQGPTKFELVINLKTARSIGLTIPPTLLARADEVIE